MVRLACKYMRFYKSQTFALLLSIVLTAALLAGVSSLLYSSQMSELENNKTMYGSWHYRAEADEETIKEILGDKEKAGEGFCLEDAGRMELKDMITEPLPVSFVYGDEGFLRLMNRDILEGKYPQGADEIAADRYTLGNLGFTGNVGDTLTIDGKAFVLTGIVKSRWAAASDEMEIFTGEEYQKEKAVRSYIYLRFDEEEKLYRQMGNFQKEYGVSGDKIEANDEVVMYLGGEKPEPVRDIVKFALTDERGNLTYIVLKLWSEYNLGFYGMVFLLCLFSLFVTYSIFSISVSKRTAEYGIMQTLGISDGYIAGALACELWMLLVAGYPAGCILGNGLLRIFYRTGSESRDLYTAYTAAAAGFFFLFAALGAVGFITVYSLRKQSVSQTMLGDISFAKGRRKVRRRKYTSLADVAARRFLFGNKRRVAGILLSLSLGGCLFLCTTYMVENLKAHAEMSMKSDDGLGSEYRISLKSNRLSDMLQKSVMEEIRGLSGLDNVYGVKYVLGELTVSEKELTWPQYFDEKNKDPYFQETYGGICVKREDGSYGIKYDVYGYDKEMIEELQEFVLEGDINGGVLKADEIIAAANMDGQGNYMFYGKHPGDTVTLRVPKDLNCEPGLLKFQGAEENYVEKEFKIAAVVSRALAKEDQYLNVGGWQNSQSLIMTGEQMEQLYGITGFSIAGASLSSEADAETLKSRLFQILQDAPGAVLKDYHSEIAVRKSQLAEKQMFFTGIAVILLVISLFHLMNSMNHSILSHRREFGIMRAMGITEGAFLWMILRVGILYGLLSDAFIFLFYHLALRKVMDYYMMHVVQFLHLKAGVPAGIQAAVMGLNLLICAFTVLLPARKIVKSQDIKV